jgi:hypothetical protein
MDPVLKMWLYNQWLGDHRDDAELAKNHAYLLGSFFNPEAVQQMLNSNVHESSDSDFEESLRMVTDVDLSKLGIGNTTSNKEVVPKRRRRKSTLKE